MSPSEEHFLKVRTKLDDLGYLQPLSFESVLLVDKLLDDLLETKRKLQHYKNVAQQSMEACSELQVGVGPYKEDNAKLIKENNDLRQKLIKSREAIEDTKVELRREIRNLEKERTLQDYLCSQHASKISHLQSELSQKSAKLMEYKGIKANVHSSGPYKKHNFVKINKDQMLEKSQEKINHLTQEILKLKSDQQELDDFVECLKNKVCARDKEIERLSSLLSNGRPLKEQNQCPCCSPQLLDCRILAKNKQLNEELEDSKQKQHEAMVRAIELAERNQMLEERRLPSARSDSSKKCCCAENSNKICKLQEKLEERILQVERLEQELSELKKTHSECISDKKSVNKILEVTLEDKKRLNDRINELTIIEHDLMLEIDRLKRTTAIQKSQLAELENQLIGSDLTTKETDKPKNQRTVPARTAAGLKKSYDSKRPIQMKKVVLKPVVPAAMKPPHKRFTQRPAAPATEPSTLSSSPVFTTQPRAQSPPPTQRSASPPLARQLLVERRQFEQQLEEMAKQQAEHCAKFHPPSCPRSARPDQPQKESDTQWLVLERLQAERDYYHKEFSRLRDQLYNIPDHSTESSKEPSSPHEKLERLLSERDYYHREMCRLLDKGGPPTSHPDKTVLASLKLQLASKEDEVNVLQGKLADLQHKLASLEVSSKVWERIEAKEEDIKILSNKIKELEQQVSTDTSQVNEELRRKLNLKEEEILNLTERLKNNDRLQTPQDNQHSVNDLWRKLNLKEEEILALREKIREMERNHVSPELTLTNSELWRRLNLKEDELLKMQEKIRNVDLCKSDYSLLKRRYDQKEEENLCLREKIREYECNKYNNSGMHQAIMTRLEMERDSAKGDCQRLREENSALREDMMRLKECQRDDQLRLEQAKKDFDSCVSQFEVERQGLHTEIKQLTEDIRLFKDKLHTLQSETGEHRTRSNHFKMVNEQMERELRTTQDLLQQTEAELASALDRIQELNDEIQRYQWETKELRQEQTCLKANMTRLDQEKDSLLLKVDEKTEHNVHLGEELESRDRRIASLEGFIADLQKKLDVALDTAARSEQSTRQHSTDTDRLRRELNKMEKSRDNAVRENSRLQSDLAALTNDHRQISQALEGSRREVEDLKLQLQGYVTELRRITQLLEEKEAERMSMLEHYRSLTVESANLETNNQSLESEARSTKSCLREAQNRIQDLEGSLQEKKALVQGYEKQIKELTHQVAKLERKLDARSRTENATRDMSRELESQKHCLAKKVDELTCDKQQLEEEVRGLREELAELQTQLGKERRNSATLENVLASARQETLQRSRDNSELQAQVRCLQTKLADLQDKLEHGSEALRRCQAECTDYQAQVADLKREVTNQRFERAKVEENRGGCTCPLKGRCSCCVLVCGSLASLPLSQQPSSCDDIKVRDSSTCTCIRIPLPPVPSSTSFPKHSRLKPDKLIENASDSTSDDIQSK